MFRSLLIAAVCCALMTSGATAAPSSLMKGIWSLGYTFDGASDEILAGYNISDMDKLIVNFALNSVDPGQDAGIDQDSDTGWAIGGALHHYLNGLSTSNFAPFIGGGVSVGESAFAGTDANTRIDARFGAEAFPIDPIGISGHIGIGYFRTGEEANGDDGPSTIGFFRSGVSATFYWDW
jgi:hypothetical protein